MKPDFSDTSEYLKVCPEDLSLYFAETYWFFLDKKRWEYVLSFEPNGAGGISVTSRHTGFQSRHRTLEEGMVSFAFPESGLYNYKKGVISFRRKIARQNKKSLCSSNGDVYSNINLFASFPLPTAFHLSQLWRWSVSNVNAVFGKDSKYPEYPDAFEGISRMRNFSRAISTNLFLSQGILSKHPSLWFRQTLIGRCLTPDLVAIANPLFFQEAVDFFSPLGVSVDSETIATTA